jgi:hypothetical protein
MTSNTFSSHSLSVYPNWTFKKEIISCNIVIVHSDRRLADHFGGKLHLGYMLIREKLKELQVHSCIPLKYDVGSIWPNFSSLDILTWKA